MHLKAAKNDGFPQHGDVPRPVSHHCDGRLSNNHYSLANESVAASANGFSSTDHPSVCVRSTGQPLKALYTPEQRKRRDATKWTLVQGILAPVQFLIFLISLVLILRYLTTSEGREVAAASIVIKTTVLYAIMITGSIWEREVFGVYLFAPAFFWEDVFSFLVLALHTIYLVALFARLGSPHQQMLIALAAYASYFINATQFLMKLRAARRDERLVLSMASSMPGRSA